MEPTVVIHDKLEPPIQRKRMEEGDFWMMYSFYDAKTNSIHILDPTLIQEAFILYQRNYIDRMSSMRRKSHGLTDLRYGAFFGLLLFSGLAVFILAGILNVTMPYLISNTLIGFVVAFSIIWIILKTTPETHARKATMRHLKQM